MDITSNDFYELVGVKQKKNIEFGFGERPITVLIYEIKINGDEMCDFESFKSLVSVL